MSIERTASGGYSVRYRDHQGRNRRKTFSHGDGNRTPRQLAREFHDQIRHERHHGPIRNTGPRNKTVDEVAVEWAKTQGHLAPKTKTCSQSLYRAHIHPEFGDSLVDGINAHDIEIWLAGIERPHARKRAFNLLRQILRAARRWDYCSENVADLVPVPKLPRKEEVKPFSPVEVEEIRAAMLADGRLRDATLVSALAYSGPRPQEALRYLWPDVGERALSVLVSPKTGKRRSVTLLEPLAVDLAQWRQECPSTALGLVFPSAEGKRVGVTGWDNWRKRVWAKYAPEGTCPYQLRHTFVSLLLRERLAVEVARQAGHSLRVLSETYAHEIEELSGRGGAEDAICEARAEVHGSPSLRVVQAA